MAIKRLSAPSTFAVFYQFTFNFVNGADSIGKLKKISAEIPTRIPNSNWFSIMLRKVKRRKKCSFNYQCSHDANKNWQSDAFDEIDLSLNGITSCAVFQIILELVKQTCFGHNGYDSKSNY